LQNFDCFFWSLKKGRIKKVRTDRKSGSRINKGPTFGSEELHFREITILKVFTFSSRTRFGAQGPAESFSTPEGITEEFLPRNK